MHERDDAVDPDQRRHLEARLLEAQEGSDALQRELDATVVTQASRELEAIEAALDRFYRQPHRFGIAEDTGEELPFERLDAIPWATTAAPRH